eukprot:scaffold5337_cov167-Amphora_coffeaeformis.AAC.1
MRARPHLEVLLLRQNITASLVRQAGRCSPVASQPALRYVFKTYLSGNRFGNGGKVTIGPHYLDDGLCYATLSVSKPYVLGLEFD